jgi:hypothetical protein
MSFVATRQVSYIVCSVLRGINTSNLSGGIIVDF